MKVNRKIILHLIMNHLPLPNELIRKIYQYIHPIYEYQQYLHALKKHEEENNIFDNILETRTNISYVESKINYFDVIASYAMLMNEQLSYIHTFLNCNPRFKRSDDLRLLKQGQYKTMWDYEYDKNIIECWDKNMMKENNLVDALKNGSLLYITYLCSLNNINCPIMLDKNEREKRNFLVGQLMLL